MNNEDDNLELDANDYLEKDENFWKEYRKSLYNFITKEEKIVEKTPENIYNMAKEIGVKPTARYFDIYPSQVRYYIKKIEKTDK